MRICMILGAYPPMKCGVGDYTSMLSKALSQKGNDIHIITSQLDGKNVVKNQDNIHIYHSVEQWNFSAYKGIRSIIDKIQPDIVHIQYPSDEYGNSFFINILPAILKIRYKVKIVETVHEYMNYTAKGKIRNLINYLFSNEIIVVEKRYIQSIKEFLPIVSKRLKLTYIPISSNIPCVSLTDSDKHKIRDKFEVQDKIYISYFGFINELKGLETLLLAVKELKMMGMNFKLVCIAELRENDSYHDNIKNKISELEVRDNIVFTGFVEDAKQVSEYLAASDLCVLPFRDGVSERNGSFLAAYVQGIPIITTSKSEKSNSDGVYFTKPNAHKEIANYILELFDIKVRFDRISLSWEDVCKSHLNVYNSI